MVKKLFGAKNGLAFKNFFLVLRRKGNDISKHEKADFLLRRKKSFTFNFFRQKVFISLLFP
jgi:hypothetical protein